MKKLTAILCCITLLALSLGGCKGDPSSRMFRYDLPGPVENLDPQFATDPSARMILDNLYEGLLVQGADGAIQPGVAESYTVSADLLVYTFSLRNDAAWSSEDPVTAADFVFAFHRMFGSGSPLATGFAAIENGSAILRGETNVSELGVRAVGDHTLIIALGQPDPFLLERLCDPAAAPCSEKAFNESMGRYGLELDFVCTNGPFRLLKWDNTKYLQIWPSETYRSDRPVTAGGVNLYVGRDAATQFLSGKTDLAVLSFEDQDDLGSHQATVLPLQKTVWCIVFNQNHRVWGNALMRQGLAHTVDHHLMAEKQGPNFVSTSVLIPNALQLLDTPFRKYAAAESPLNYNTQQGQRLFEMGLSSLGIDTLPAATNIQFSEQAAISLNLGELQQGWQKYLSAYINFEQTTAAQVQRNFRSGDYQILLMPFTPADSSVSSLLDVFASDSSQNYFGYQNVLYDELLQSAHMQPTVELTAQKYAQAETMLLSDAVVIPLYFETTYLAIAPEVQDLEISPFGDRIYFKYAQKNG